MEPQGRAKTRALSIDLIKIISMALVVALHTTRRFSIEPWSLGAIIYRTSDIAVPLFFMVSGYLLIGRSLSRATYSYTLRKVWGIVRFTLILSAVYVICQWIKGEVTGSVLRISGLIVSTTLKSYIMDSDLWMLWYFGAMIILYLLYPLINRAYVRRYGVYKAIIIMAGAIAFICFIGNVLRVPYGERVMEHYVSQPFRVWNWTFYFCAGGLIHKMPVIALKPTYTMVGLAVLALLNLAQQAILEPHMDETACEYFYGSPVTMAFAIGTFYAISRQRIERSKIISVLSTLFLPVFVIHVFVIGWTDGRGYIHQVLSTGPVLAPLILWFGVTAISVAISLVLMQVPYMAKIMKI